MTGSRQQGFTLAEMLTVLVIMAIVLSIAIPAVTSLSKASALNAATREVSNTLSLARQYAITHRTNARVVFPYNGTVSVPPRLDMWYHTYAVMTNRDNSAAAAAGWRYVSKWEYLPSGAVFLNDGNPSDGSLNDIAPVPNPNGSVRTESLPFPDSPTPPVNNAILAYIEFGPTGAATQAGTITVEEGFIDNYSLPQRTTPVNKRWCVMDPVVGHIQVKVP